MLGGSWRGCSVRDIMGDALCDLSCLSLRARYFGFQERKPIDKELIMINNELSKSSLGSTDITTPCRYAKNERKINDVMAL